MKNLRRQQLKAMRLNKLRHNLREQIKQREATLKGFKDQIKDLRKVSPAIAKQAEYSLSHISQAGKMPSFNKEKFLQKHGPSVHTNSKRWSLPNRYEQAQQKAWRSQVKTSDVSLRSAYDVKGVKNLITYATVKANEKYGVKLKKKGDKLGMERPTYQVSYEDVPKDRLTEVKNAVRRTKRHISQGQVGLINEIMGMIKKIYANGGKIAQSDEVFERTIDFVQSHPGFDINSDNVRDVLKQLAEG